MFLRAGLSDGLPIISLAPAHPSAGGSKHQRKMVCPLPLSSQPCFISGNQKQPGGAIQPRGFTFTEACGGNCRDRFHFSSLLDPLCRCIEEGDGTEGSFSRPKALGVQLPSCAERRDDSCTSDDDPVSGWRFWVGWWEKHVVVG